MARPLTVAPFNWADRIEVGAGFEDMLVEAVFGANDYSFATYFEQATFGFVDIRTGGRVLRRNTFSLGHQLHLANDGVTWASGATREAVYEAAVEWFLNGEPEVHFGPPLSAFDARQPPSPPWLIFMLSAPSPAGGLPTVGACVLDWHGKYDYMAHELGHALGWVHSRGVGGDYNDPYCIMSAQGYAGMNPTHTRQRAADSRIPDNPLDAGRCFWGGGFGPMPAAATLYRQLPEFRASSMVVPVQADQRVGLRALSEARRGDPVLAVMEYSGEVWMAEFRLATNWDAGLLGNPTSPGEGVVLHTWRPGDAGGAVYGGRVGLLDPTQPSLQPPWSTRMKLVVDHVDIGAKTVELHFTEGDPPYAFGTPAPKFADLAFDPACHPAGLTEVSFDAAYDRVAASGGARTRFHVVIIDGAGQQRTGYGQVPQRDNGYGVTMQADECRNGEIVGHWSVIITKIDLGLGGGATFMFRINGDGFELAGVLNPVEGRWQAEVDDLTVVFTGWQTATIY